MKAPLFAVLAVTAIVVAVVLILVIGASPNSSKAGSPREEVELLIGAFELSDCDNAEMVGGMTVSREQTSQRISAFIADAKCVAELREAAAMRGFDTDASGDVTLDVSPTSRETLTLYQPGATGETAFEWERIQL